MKVVDIAKLNEIVNRISKNYGIYSSKTSCFIGKTPEKIIVISAYSPCEFEREFDEDPTAVDEKYFVLGDE